MSYDKMVSCTRAASSKTTAHGERGAVVFSDLIVLYLFLGGAAAGSFAVLSAIDLYEALFKGGRERFPRARPARRTRRAYPALQRRVMTTGYAMAFVMLVVGMLCLLADLGRPEEFYLLFLRPTGSFVSIGTFALALLTACVALALAESALVLGPAWRRTSLIAKALGAVAAVAVMVYTGLLLDNVVAVDLWQSWLLPVLFLLSALSCGCAVVLLSAGFCEGCSGELAWVRRLPAVDAGVIVLEAIAALALAATVNAASADRPFDALLTGDQACAFWFGFVGCGILAPLAVEASALFARHGRRPFVFAVMAALVLVGGFSLRSVLVHAGVQTAV